MTTIKNSRSTYALIDLKRFGSNLEAAKRLSKSDIIAVVKADAYGHGAKEISKYAYENHNIQKFAVATMVEGIELKKYFNNNTEIIVLGYIAEEFIKEALSIGLILPVYDYKYAESISKIAYNMGITANVAIEIDTGMSRLGFSYDLSLDHMLELFPNLKVKHAISHLATSDSDNSFAHIQCEKFDKFLEINSEHIFSTSFLNSSGIINYENRWNYTRAGIILYGYASLNIINNFKPVMSIYSEITHVKSIKKGESVGYGRTFIAYEDTVVGVVPIGYADGYLRSFSNKGYMIVDGKKCKILGMICMDMTMIDITSIGESARGKKVTVMNDDISAEILASWGNTISYEILSRISSRIPRVYID